MRAAGEGHGDLHVLAGSLLGREGCLELGGIKSGPGILEFIGNRDCLTILVEVEQGIHRQRLRILHHLAGGVEVRFRAQDMPAINAARR